VGSLAALVLLAFVEIPLFFLNNARDRNAALQRRYSDGFISEDPLLGHRPFPSNRYTETVTFQGKPVFSASYGIDENRRRVVPVQPVQPADHALLFFGCSFTFGTGVNDEETLPCQAAKLLPALHVYNFAGVGDGPHQMLAQLTQGDLRKVVLEKQATVVYVFIPQHLSRSIMSMRHAVAWGRNDPAFAVREDHSVVYLGPVCQAHPWRLFFYDLLSHEQILRRMNADWPPAILEKHIQYNADLIVAASRSCQELFTPVQFKVVFYPLSGRISRNLGVDWDHQAAVFKHAGLDVLDYRSLAAPGEDDLFYAVDEHPTAKMHQRIAAQLANDLKNDPLHTVSRESFSQTR